jgi:hypothetical protein
MGKMANNGSIGLEIGIYKKLEGEFKKVNEICPGLREYIPLTGERTISGADMEQLFGWNREVPGQ